MKRTLAVLAALVMGATLTACGDDGDSNSSDNSSSSSDASSYCDLIEEHLSAFQEFDFGSATGDTFAEFQDAVDEIQAVAPDDVKADWETMGEALTQFQAFFEKAGLSVDDLQGLVSGNIPEGVSAADLQQLQKDLTDFSANNDFQESLADLPDEVKDECGLELDTTPTDDSAS